MARDLNLLDADFQDKVEKLLAACEKRGVTMKPFYTLRSVYDQAKLYRQSRSFTEIKHAADRLKELGAPWLSEVLLGVGAQNGRWATNALPAFSWHQHGLAVDCYWLVNGNAEWSTTKKIGGVNGYEIYAEEAQKLGLESGHLWRSKDSVHVQATSGSVTDMINSGQLTYQSLDEKMKEMFG